MIGTSGGPEQPRDAEQALYESRYKPCVEWVEDILERMGYRLKRKMDGLPTAEVSYVDGYKFILIKSHLTAFDGVEKIKKLGEHLNWVMVGTADPVQLYSGATFTTLSVLDSMDKVKEQATSVFKEPKGPTFEQFADLAKVVETYGFTVNYGRAAGTKQTKFNIHGGDTTMKDLTWEQIQHVVAGMVLYHNKPK